MKLTGPRIESFLKKPDAAVRVVLVYGPDSGLIKERLDRLALTVLADLSDPFRLSDLSAAQVKDDPARLADEAAALALTGGRRVVRVRDAADGVTAAFRSFLADPHGDALVLAEGGELGPRSTLRKLCEEAANAAALPCYADEGSSLDGVIIETLRKSGVTAEAEAIAWLADHLGGDRKMTRSELEKLALYMGKGGRVRLDDAIACIGDTSALSFDDLANAVSEGDQAAAQRVLDRLFAEGTNAIAILRILQRHFQRLHLLTGLMAAGRGAEQAVASLKPPVHFRAAERLRAQCGRWSVERVGTAMDLLVGAEIDCKSTGAPSNELCSRAIMQITRAAGRRAEAPRFS